MLAFDYEHGQKSKLKLGVTVESINRISKTYGFVDIQFKIYVQWTDSRLVFKNVAKGIHSYCKNKISEKQKSLIWLPSIIMNNTRSKSKITFDKTGDEEESIGAIFIKKRAHGQKSLLNELLNYVEYDGRDRYVQK